MAIITELDNALQDVRPPMTKFLNRVADNINSKENTNSSIIGGDSFNATVPVYSGVNLGNGYVVSGSPRPALEFSTFPVTFYKTDFVQAYNLGIGINIVIKDFAGGSFPSFNTPLYLTIFRTLPIGILTPNGQNLEPVIIYPLGNINWTDGPGFTWQTVNPSTALNLKDTIVYRDFLSSSQQYDFSNNSLYNANNKFTESQYADLLNTIIGWQATVVYDDSAISPTQKAFIDSALGLGSPYGISLTLAFKAFGLLASYRPIN